MELLQTRPINKESILANLVQGENNILQQQPSKALIEEDNDDDDVYLPPRPHRKS